MSKNYVVSFYILLCLRTYSTSWYLGHMRKKSNFTCLILAYYSSSKCLVAWRIVLEMYVKYIPRDISLSGSVHDILHETECIVYHRHKQLPTSISLFLYSSLGEQYFNLISPVVHWRLLWSCHNPYQNRRNCASTSWKLGCHVNSSGTNWPTALEPRAVESVVCPLRNTFGSVLTLSTLVGLIQFNNRLFPYF